MTIAQYEKTCHFSDWEKYCQDKYLSWAGTVEDVDTLKKSVVVKIKEDTSIEADNVSNADSINIGERVLVSGILTKHGLLTDTIEDGAVEKRG